MAKKASKDTENQKPANRKIKLNKETLKDLDPSGASKVKGGAIPNTRQGTCGGYTCYVRWC